MKTIDIENRDAAELSAMLKDLRAKLTRLQFDAAEKKLKDFSQLGKMKRDIARIMTALNQRLTTNDQRQESEKVVSRQS